MIQRSQSVFLLLSIVICGVFFFLPIGYIHSMEELVFKVTGFVNQPDGFASEYIFSLPAVLAIIMLLQIIAIFMYKNRPQQAKVVQVSLILLLVFAFLTLLYQDIFGTQIGCFPLGDEIEYTWNVLLLAIPWILTFMALRNIRKDEALVRSADRMR